MGYHIDGWKSDGVHAPIFFTHGQYTIRGLLVRGLLVRGKMKMRQYCHGVAYRIIQRTAFRQITT